MNCADWESVSKSISREMGTTLEKLSEKPGWRDTFNKRIEKVWNENNWYNIKLAASAVQEEIQKENFPFKVYTSIKYIQPESKGGKKNKCVFDLRYMGQNVGELIIEISNNQQEELRCIKSKTIVIPKLTKKKNQTEQYMYEKNVRDFGKPEFENVLGKSWGVDGVSLESAEAKAFFKFFQSKPQRNTKENNPVKQEEKDLRKNAEHKVESILIGTLYGEKENLGVQPIRLHDLDDFDIRFAMTTALSASAPDAKKEGHIIKVTERVGGGIDILATPYPKDSGELTVIEVKDQYTDAEPPLIALGQAGAYAVFLQQLLRDKQGPMWWQLFGMKGEIPEQLTIRIVSAMPYKENAANDLDGLCGKGRYIPIEADKPNGDRVEVHTLFFNDEGREIVGTTLEK